MFPIESKQTERYLTCEIDFAVFRIQIASLIGSTADVPIYDPVFKFYEPHEGEVVNVCFSPNRKDMFLTNGTDGEIRIYTTGQVFH